MINPTPTKRAVIDPLRACNLKCSMCYYLHGDMKSIKPFDVVKKDIDAAIARGNNYIDVTGGEPTIYPQICELVKYALDKGVRTCIITNAITPVSIMEKIIDAGIDQFLISIHGTEQVHDKLVCHPGARKKQIQFLELLKSKGVSFRFNCVINSFNQNEILQIAEWMSPYKPSIVNFINMNPHGEWSSKINETRKVIADLRLVEPNLNLAIQHLESNGIGVNVRYYPMCRIAPEYRRCICNDLHVVFDPYEWDYNIQPKTLEAHKTWGEHTSNCMEEKDGKCKSCQLFKVCGGINKAFNRATEGKMIDSITSGINEIEKNDFYLYRKHNEKTLEAR